MSCELSSLSTGCSAAKIAGMRRPISSVEEQYLRLAIRAERCERPSLLTVLFGVLPGAFYALVAIECLTGATRGTSGWRFLLFLLGMLLSIVAGMLRLRGLVAACFRSPAQATSILGLLYRSAVPPGEVSERSSDEMPASFCYIGLHQVYVPMHWRPMLLGLKDHQLRSEVYVAPWQVCFPLMIEGIASIETDVGRGLLQYRRLSKTLVLFTVAVCAVTVAAVFVAEVPVARSPGFAFRDSCMKAHILASVTLLTLVLRRWWKNARLRGALALAQDHSGWDE
jgi:hypothetical protein